jgi:5-methylcytosine-specific restriction endonuclease McrA
LRRPYRSTDEEVRLAVAQAVSIADALRRLGPAPRGANYRILRRRIRELGLTTEHLLGQGWRKGSRRPVPPARKLEDILTIQSPYQSSKLKNRLIAAGYKHARCEACGLTEWNGLPIPLELHHINGDSTDNRIENLRILCPNCHAQTSNRGKNIGSAN